MAVTDKIRLRVKRGLQSDQRWEEFAVPAHAGANVISCLMHVQRHPVTADGRATTPVVWDSNCLEEVCGACSMIINGRVRQACSALISKLEQPVTVEPMTKFPLVRDLMVDRQFMFDSLRRVHAWIPIDGTYDLGPGPRLDPEIQADRYVLSTCMTCGCCLEACPQVNDHSPFIGAAAISQVRLFNLHPTGKIHAATRLRGLMGPGGIDACNKDENCVAVCPKEIPLTSSLSELGRATLGQSLSDLFLSDHGAKSHAG